MSALPAQRLGLHARRPLRPGMKADVVVFDAERVKGKATFAEPHQYAEGFSYVIVNGAVVLDDGKMTEARPGGRCCLALWRGGELAEGCLKDSP